MTLIGIYIGGTSLLDALLPHRQDPTEYETLIALTAFFRGFQLLAVSVVGEYVGRIYLSLNCDSQFVIRENFRPEKTSSLRTLA